MRRLARTIKRALRRRLPFNQTRFAMIEAAAFEAYRGGCTLADIDRLMTAAGFCIRGKIEQRNGAHPTLGRYYDVISERRRR